MGATLLLRVYDGTEMVMEGTAKEISKALHIPNRNTVTACAKRNRKLLWKYTVECLGTVSKVKPTLSMHDKELDYLYRHLRYKDSVYFHADGEEFRKELRKMGIRFKAVPCVTFKDGYILWRV